jgi:hypothetical protein
MKPVLVLLVASLAVLAGCANAPRPRAEARDVAQRLGLPADAPSSAHGCRYAQALPEDDFADFVGATCVVFADRLAIVRARGRSDRPAYFRYKALEGVAVASFGFRSQLQMLAAGTVLVIELDASPGSAAAQERAFATAKREGVPVFQADFVQPRNRGAFVPPSF